MPSLDNILAIILGGGRGSRLYPLTKLRSKPAVPMGGKYRLIDIPISNCINSGIYRIAVLTQFNSVSLHRHITQTYVFDVFHTGAVYIWAAEQTMENADWYQGTADAVRKQLFQIRSARADYVLILAGDHLYRMDYSEMARFHWEHNADITVAVQPVRADEAHRLGILKRDSEGRILRFAEKPKDPALLADLISRDDPIRPYLGSMGIYMFKTNVLIDVLENNAFDDFGGQVIPHALNTHRVYGFDFDGYWEDIGTIRAFYETNLALADPNPRFNLYDPQRPIYSHARFLPGSILDNCVLEHVLLTEGCSLKRCEVRHSVIGLRSQIRSGTVILDSILMGADYYDSGCMNDDSDEGPEPCIGIGRDCFIQGAIIDKNARIGRNVIIKPFPRGVDMETENWTVQDGIVVVPKGAILTAGTIIAPKV
ncbi:MAG TPA: glucose-1-phosphate adenylyltransferase [Anaerolinea thermolimosa]|uniref:Glucose-1-phosphate adenylyltransferase n=1 Tax=Anaerolinea thermolimosa TaxID=229919 RepID=A0A3D1JJ04_9CHLR|nr:glucose-1-phosphate adenylyltransferase [Anaerolinea thermolimosa]